MSKIHNGIKNLLQLVFSEFTLAYGLVIFFVLVYVLTAIALFLSKRIELKDLFGSITIIVGWLIAVALLWANLTETKANNRRLKNEEIKKAIERESFKEINKAITNLSWGITKLSTTIFSMPGMIKSFIAINLDPKINEKAKELWNEELEMMRLNTEFTLAIEANEIAVIKYDHYRKFLHMRIQDLFKEVTEFREQLAVLKIEELKVLKIMTEFAVKCYALSEKHFDIQCYLHDYRIELMNNFLEEIFEEKVPERNIPVKKHKLLREVATKEAVQKESEEREKKALLGNM